MTQISQDEYTIGRFRIVRGMTNRQMVWKVYASEEGRSTT